MSLAAKVREAFPNAINLQDYIVEASGTPSNRTERIGFWNVKTLGTQPSEFFWDSVNIPEPPPVPDWRSFRASLVMSSAYGRITGFSNHTLSILPVLVNVAFLLDSDATRAIEFAGLWNAIATTAQPTTEEIAALNAIATAANVPFQLNSAGLIT